METCTERVTIVIGPRESFVHSKRSLESLYATTRVPFKLLYMDAGSPFWVRAYLQREATRNGFRLIRSSRFAAPNAIRNRALSYVDTEFVVFADNDVLFAENWLEALLACADEEDAPIVVPLITIGDKPFTVIHSSGGFGGIEATPTGRSYKGHQRHINVPLSQVTDTLRREPVTNVEFHCFLARTSVLRNLPAFDEALTTTLELDDFGLTASQAGTKMLFEPRAMVNQFLPLALPRGFGDTPFLLQRWDHKKSVASVTHFARKWNVSTDDEILKMKLYWTGYRRRQFLLGDPLCRLMRHTKGLVTSLSMPRRRPLLDKAPLPAATGSTPGAVPLP